MNQRTIILNELAQGIRPLAQDAGWFERLADTEQIEVLRDRQGSVSRPAQPARTGRRASAELTSGPPTPPPCWSRMDASSSN